MGSGKKSGSRSSSRSRRQQTNVESGYTPKPNAGVSGLLANIPGPVIAGVCTVELVMGIVFVIVGALHIDDCQVEIMVPVWLVMMGCALILAACHEYFHYYRRSKHVGHGRGLISLITTFALIIMLVGFFIVGNVFVFTAYNENPDFGHTWFENGCNHATFNLAFISICIMDALMGILVLAVLFFAIYTALCSPK